MARAWRTTPAHVRTACTWEEINAMWALIEEENRAFAEQQRRRRETDG